MPTADIVTQLFQNMLGRMPSAAERDQWVGRIDSGAETAGQVAVDLLNTQEGGNAAAVVRLYQAAFGRTPDLAGLQVQLGSGLSTDVLARNFVNSAEFRATFVNLDGSAFNATDFVTKLYNNILGRSPDPGGLTFQVNFYNSQIASGHSDADTRATLLQNFANSAELKGNSAINFDKAVLLWAGLDNTIPVSTTSSPNTMLQQANGVPPSTLASALNDGVNGNDVGAWMSVGGQILVAPNAAGTTISGTIGSDTFMADWAGLAGSTIRGDTGLDTLVIKGTSANTSLTIDSVERVVLTAASALATLTLNVTGTADNLSIVGASGDNKITIAAPTVKVIDYEADAAPGSKGSVVDFTGSTSLTTLTVHGSQAYAISGLANGVKVDASAATGNGTIDGHTATAALTILGGKGNDTITGGAGADTLTGGGGDDLFRFAFDSKAGTGDSPASATLVTYDSITDFSRAVSSGATKGFDRIQLTDLAGAAKFAVAADGAGSVNGMSWTVTNGVLHGVSGNPHIFGTLVATALAVADAAAPSIGDAFVFYTGNMGGPFDGSQSTTFLFVQGGANDVLVQLSGVLSASALNLSGGSFFLTA